MSLLSFRSDLTRAIRNYFYASDVVEVTTASLRAAGTSDVHLENLAVELKEGRSYLQTSPEYAMKILLASHRDLLFQICPAFRGGETGTRHRVEFQMLEWYRWGYRLPELADDLISMLTYVQQALADQYDTLPFEPVIRRVTYRELFEARYDINPHLADEAALKGLAMSVGLDHLAFDASQDDYLDGLFSVGVEPDLVEPTIVYDFPACQAALAETRQRPSGDLVSDRFELYVRGLELANAYQELTDAEELERRLKGNNLRRKQLGKPLIPLDAEMIQATGRLETCAGIALGVDRLVMVLLGAETIEAVI